MFVMHESKRLKACRVGFVLFGVLPTLAVCAWIVWIHSSHRNEYRRQEIERYLTEYCGLLVSVDSLHESLDGTMILSNVSAIDRESQAVVAKIRSIDVVRRENEIVAIASLVEVEPGQLSAVAQLLERQLTRLGTAGPLNVWVEANAVTVKTETADADRTLSQVQCSIEAKQDRVVATIDWQSPSNVVGNATVATLRLIRERAMGPATTGWELDCNGTALPCSVMADYIPGMADLGDDAQFVGTISCRNIESQWQVDVTGRFEQIDLDRMVTGRFPHRLTGDATVVLNRATLRDGWLQSAAGNLESDAGVISQSLLIAMAAELRVYSPAVTLESQADSLQRYRKLNIGFRIDEGTIELGGGELGGGELGGAGHVLIYTDRMTPLAQIDKAPRPIEAIVRTLSPLNRIQVPATKEAYDLLRWLPLPRLVRPTEIGTRPSYNPVELQ
ncbi:MAG: hypothetical protein ACI9G1_004541 [Pirellulaceae bacterium]|jgi:hypothetical protein